MGASSFTPAILSRGCGRCTPAVDVSYLASNTSAGVGPYVEVRSRILGPLGLRHTGYAGEPSAPRLGVGHVIEDGKFIEASDRWHPSIGGAAGAMYSTAADLMAFGLALFEGDLLDAKSTAEMRTFVHGEDHGYVGHAYGLGLERYTVNNLTVLGHMGNGSAHGSFIGYDPASRAAVAVQINAANPGPAAVIAAEVLGEVTGKDAYPPPKPSASVGYTLFPYRTLKRAGTGERVGKVRVMTQQASASRAIVANEGRTRLEWTIAERLWLKSILPMNAELTWLPIDALGLRASLLVSGGNYHGAESVYGVNNPQLNYYSAAADLGARWFMLPYMHLTVHGGYTLHRRFEFSDGRHTVADGKYDLANGMVLGIDLGVGR